MTRGFYLISYDIPDDKRRTKIAHLLEGYGERVQYSVFEVWATEKELETLRQQLARWVESPKPKTTRPPEKPEEREASVQGSIRIYMLCGACKQKRVVLGAGVPTEAPGLQII